MRRKIGVQAVFIYLFFMIAVYCYLYFGGDSGIPEAFRGTSADPATFLNGRELMLSEEYSRIRNFLFFVSIPFEWLFLLLMLLGGLSQTFERWAAASSKSRILQTAIYVFWLSIITLIAAFPFKYIGYYLSKEYNISTQSFSSWMKDQITDFWLNFGLTFLLVSVLYWLIQKSQKRWWLYAWLLSVPFSFFMMFLQPVVIDPLYNDFYPLKDKKLETKILEMADKADIPADHVYEVNMAEKTNSLNAYVTGVGSNSRIVLWDTTLNRLEDDEILFIMAHEMAHYVEKHIYIGISGYLLLSLAGLWVIAKIMDHAVRKWGGILQVSSVRNISSLPLFLLVASILTFASAPLSNAVSRYQEARADSYAIKMTQDSQSAIGTFQELTRAGLSEVNPPYLVKLFRYSHPTMLERISALEQYDREKE
ncbi:M48 family peptidase [Peribacillus saganii]|uniref:M48 family peptidase n=1 Tax=Peribacillus saganii TaxID=2303992 RepID=A0A372LCA9_9BACI|nr:M48 family metallopeptidase [Peribacillus saganii]RFU63544.1 M48 family peptidase [Peribacillus saganii]